DICGTNDSNIENPIIILDEKYKDTDRSELETLAKTEKVDGKKVYVYALVGRKDATTGAVRVNDKAYETGSPNKEYLEKVYAFLEKREMIVSNETKNPIEVCKENNQDYCEVNGIIYKKYSISDPSEYKCNDPNMCYIDPAISAYCNPYTTNRVKYSELPEDTTELYVAAPIELTDEEIEEADGNYRLAGENKCKSSGGHLASFAEVNVASKNGDYKADWYCFRETVKGPCCRASNGGGSLKCTTTSATKGGKIICAY
ncbi:hypothetical protein IJS77_05565, partial [bacterium]|nr:hypothetical protein [bacterium]